MPEDSKNADAPPEPPAIRRKFEPLPLQAVGIPLLLLLPLLALLGMLQEARSTHQAERSGLRVSVDSASRLIYRTQQPLVVSVANESDAPIFDIQVRLDRKYADRFREITFTPEPSEVTDREYVFDIPALPPGDTQQIIADMEAQDYGRHDGGIAVSAGSDMAVRIPLETLTLP